MPIRTAIAAGALVFAPALALAAEPLLVHIDGKVIPAQGQTSIIQTATGPMHVSTWSWHSPNGNGSIEVQTSTGGAPPTWALQQMRALQSQMLVVQSQMQQLEQATWNQSLALPEPLTVLFAPPVWILQGTPGTEHTATLLHWISPFYLPHAPHAKA